MDYKQKLVAFRNIVDDAMYGITQMKQNKLRGDYEVDLVLVSMTTREKIYNLIMDIIYAIRKDLPIPNFKLLKKRINIHKNQLILLNQPNVKENLDMLNTIYEYLRMILKERIMHDLYKNNNVANR